VIRNRKTGAGLEKLEKENKEKAEK